MDLIKELTKSQIKEMPEVLVGDTVKVHVKVKEGARERIQVYEGTVIAKKHGGIEETITVRRVSYGIGVEKVFPLHSPTIAMALCAGPSCTTCVIAWVRLPRSARSFDLAASNILTFERAESIQFLKDDAALVASSFSIQNRQGGGESVLPVLD